MRATKIASLTQLRPQEQGTRTWHNLVLANDKRMALARATVVWTSVVNQLSPVDTSVHDVRSITHSELEPQVKSKKNNNKAVRMCECE